MSNTYWTKHDFNIRSNDKIKELLMLFGYGGYGIYWMLNEELFNNNNCIKEDYNLLAFEFRCEVDLIKDIVEKTDLFQVENGCISSKSVAKRLKEINAKSEQARKAVNKRWSSESPDNSEVEYGRNTDVIRMNNARNTDKIREDKIREEEIREDKKREEIKNQFDLVDYINSLDVFSNAKHKVKVKHINELYKEYSKDEIIRIVDRINDKKTDVKNSISTIKNWLSQTKDKLWEEFDNKYPKEKTKNRHEAKIFFQSMPKREKKFAVHFIKDLIYKHIEEPQYMPNPLKYLQDKVYFDLYEDFKKTYEKSKRENHVSNIKFCQARMEKINDF